MRASAQYSYRWSCPRRLHLPPLPQADARVLIYHRNSLVSDSLSCHGVSPEVSGLTPRGNLQRVRKGGLGFSLTLQGTMLRHQVGLHPIYTFALPRMNASALTRSRGRQLLEATGAP
jgi:hypothetical protein